MERDLRIKNSCGDEGDVKADADPIRDNDTANVDRDAVLLEVRIRSRGREEHMLFVMTRIGYSAWIRRTKRNGQGLCLRVNQEMHVRRNFEPNAFLDSMNMST